jgi:hypothetical protein
MNTSIKRIIAAVALVILVTEGDGMPGRREGGGTRHQERIEYNIGV